MSELVAAFGRYLSEQRMLGTRTVNRYVEEARRLVTFLGDESRHATVEAADKKVILSFLRHPTTQGVPPSRATWNARLAAVRALYEYLFQEEVLEVNPALRIDRQRVPRADRLPLSLDEVLALVDAARLRSPEGFAARNVALIHVFFHCALRVAEVVSLDLDQVDFDNRLFLSVRTKGNKRLSVLFNDVVAEALEKYLPERQQVGDGHGALFLSLQRRRLSVRAVENLVVHYARLAGINRKVTPHLLRHSSATELAGLTSIRVVQEHCGHSSVSTTERYVHVNRSQRREAVDALGHRWREKETSRVGEAKDNKKRPKFKA